MKAVNELESDPKVQSFVRHSAPLLGILLLLGAVVLLGNGVRLILAPAYRAPLDNPIGGAVLLVAAVGILVLALRLMLGRRREDGGVLPPWLIAAGGLMFLVAPVIVFRITGHLYATVLSAVAFTGIAGSALTLVRKRHAR